MEVQKLWEKKDEKNDDKLIGEKRSEIIKRKKYQKNDDELKSEKWKVKSEMMLLWEKKKDQKREDELKC
jgi:hypothetical protein